MHRVSWTICPQRPRDSQTRSSVSRLGSLSDYFIGGGRSAKLRTSSTLFPLSPRPGSRRVFVPSLRLIERSSPGPRREPYDDPNRFPTSFFPRCIRSSEPLIRPIRNLQRSRSNGTRKTPVRETSARSRPIDPRTRTTERTSRSIDDGERGTAPSFDAPFPSWFSVR